MGYSSLEKFALHPKLEVDSTFVAEWPLSRVLLMNDARYPWLILVPRKADLTELHDLQPADRMALIEEISRASERLKAISGAAKINVGALGNLVPQLHIHVVARRPGDPAWPGPVWGQGAAEPYDEAARARLLGQLRMGL